MCTDVSVYVPESRYSIYMHIHMYLRVVDIHGSAVASSVVVVRWTVTDGPLAAAVRVCSLIG